MNTGVGEGDGITFVVGGGVGDGPMVGMLAIRTIAELARGDPAASARTMAARVKLAAAMVLFTLIKESLHASK